MHRLASASADRGEVDGSMPLERITIHFRPSASQMRDLSALLAGQQDRSSRDFHRWLTPDQYARRFGLSETDIGRIRTWLENAGFTDIQVPASRARISMSGTAAQVAYAFQTAIHHYEVRGERHYANSGDPVLPRALEGMVAGITGLHDFRLTPQVSTPMMFSANPSLSLRSNTVHLISPADFATIYNVRALHSTGITGVGQKIAIAGQTDIDVSDIRAFRGAAGLPASDPQIVLAGADPGTRSGDQLEANLDVEWSGAVAPQAAIVYVNSSNVGQSLEYAVDNNLAPVVSFSYGRCEANVSAADASAFTTVSEQANAQGITILAASGDSGAAGCDYGSNPAAMISTHGVSAVFPSSGANVTAVGGTELSEGTGNYWGPVNDANYGSALAYIPEVAWNDTAPGLPLLATGGGKSVLFSKPAWQQGLNVPNDAGRDVPDISFASSPLHDPYLFCPPHWCVNGFANASGFLQAVGGTSVATPAFAGIVALLNQQMGAAQGNINQTLYSLASFSSDVFHDVTSGSNQVPCQQGKKDCDQGGSIGYAAGPGYDLATGLGSVDAYNLVNEWNSDFQVSFAPATLTISRGHSGTATLQVIPVANFSGTVTFTCAADSSLNNTSCSVAGSVFRSGPVVVTVSNSSSAGAFASPRRAFPHGAGGTSIVFPGALAIFVGTLLVRSRKGMRFACAGLAFAAVVATTACDDGGGASTPAVSQTFDQPPLTGNITVTATAGLLSHSASIAVTVR
ncbi:MAG: S8/S53 family peptidase [Acidobacteriaceae bacterium]|nr:S8/S53 family peptidase [Acidobacteriaceae bacterium]